MTYPGYKNRKGPKRPKRCRCAQTVQTGEEFKLCDPCLFMADIYKRAALKRFIRFCIKIGKPEIVFKNNGR